MIGVTHVASQGGVLRQTATGLHWSNWSRLVSAHPEAFAQPQSVEELSRILTTAASTGGRVKAVGAGHSFTPVAATDGTLVNLDNLQGLIGVDRANMTATFHAGTRLRAVPELLKPHGVALPNQGDVDPQSLAGAINTGTHGTGLGFTGFGGLVRSLRILTADGVLHDARPDAPDPLDRELFRFGRVGLGAIGIVTEVELAVVDSFVLQAREHAEPVAEITRDFPERCRTADHLEFFWFPGTDVAHVKTNTRRPAETPTRPNPRFKAVVEDELVNNVAFGALCHAASRVPALTRPFARASAALLAQREYSDLAHDVFVSSRRVRFNEMEYAVPLSDAPEVLREVQQVMNASGEQVLFPVEVRSTAADDVALSSAKGRESCYIAVHRFHRDDHEALFRLVEPIFMAAGGRPHWGKLHNLGYAELVERHEDLEEFAAFRAQVDPSGIFRNAMVDRILAL